ncbi:hypothetical protein MBANPS3_000220 [Mucor bainieri]
MDSLPREIWTKVFSYIPLRKDLIQCQMVCRRWHYPAETATFSRELDIRTEKQLIQLCEHLDKDPARGSLMPSLMVHIKGHVHSIHVERLVRLAFSPNTQRIFGSVFNTDKIYQLMDSIVKNSAVKFSKMKLIGYMNNKPPSQWHYTFLLNFTDTLESLDLSTVDLYAPNNIFVHHCLDKFVNVSALLLTVTQQLTIQKLEAILNNFPGLKHVECSIEEGGAPIPTSHQVTAWVNANLKVCNNKMAMVFLSGYLSSRPDMIEYVALKYPKCCEFVFDYRYSPEDYDSEDEPEWTVNSLHRSLAALKRLKDYEMHIKIPPQLCLDDIISRMQTKDNFIVIDYYYQTERLLLARSKPRHLIKLLE